MSHTHTHSLSALGYMMAVSHTHTHSLSALGYMIDGPCAALVIRSHEVKDEGYLVEHHGKCITVFSAPNYCDQVCCPGVLPP